MKTHHLKLKLYHLFLAQLITALTIWILSSINLHFQHGTLTATNRDSVVLFWMTTDNGLPSLTINWR